MFMVPICMVPVGYYFYRAHVSVFNYFLCPLNTHTHTHTHTQSVGSLWRVRAGGGHKFLFAMFFVSAGTSVCVCVCVCRDAQAALEDGWGNIMMTLVCGSAPTAVC